MRPQIVKFYITGASLFYLKDINTLTSKQADRQIIVPIHQTPGFHIVNPNARHFPAPSKESGFC